MGQSNWRMLEADYSNPKQIAGDYESQYWIDETGVLWAQGRNYSGQLGIGSTGYEYQPRKVMAGVARIAVGKTSYEDMFTIALKEDGSVYSWGKNAHGQLGIGTTTYRISPIKVDLPKPAIAVAAGAVHSLAVLEDGTVMGWGFNGEYRLGLSTSNQNAYGGFFKPTKIPGLSNITSVTAGHESSYFIDNSGNLFVLGYGQQGELGTGITNDIRDKPIKLSIGSIKSITKGDRTTYALTTDGRLYAWGINDKGQSGIGEGISNYGLPTLIADNVSEISSGRDHTVFIDMGGNLWGFGSNAQYQLMRDDSGSHAYAPILIGQ